jgi:hypothetical protein
MVDLPARHAIYSVHRVRTQAQSAKNEAGRHQDALQARQGPVPTGWQNWQQCCRADELPPCAAQQPAAPAKQAPRPSASRRRAASAGPLAARYSRCPRAQRQPIVHLSTAVSLLRPPGAHVRRRPFPGAEQRSGPPVRRDPACGAARGRACAAVRPSQIDEAAGGLLACA